MLSSLDGSALAEGDLLQVAQGDRVTTHLIFHFKDDSLHDETAVYSQRRTFRLLSDHLIQKGPSFPHPLDATIDASTGRVVVHYTDDDGNNKDLTEEMKLPADLANGIILTLMKNIESSHPPAALSMVVTSPKPRLIKLRVSSQGEESFATGGAHREAVHYVVKLEIGGVAGLVAPLLGKQPPDIHVWILGGEAPAFVRSEGPLYPGGPVWRIELTCPSWR